MADEPAVSLQSLVECPICLSELEDPRVLTCLHSLCRECLENHIKKHTLNNKFQCPLCRCPCTLPAGGADSFPKHFLISSLKEIINQQQQREGDASGLRSGNRECSNNAKSKVPHKEAVAFCMECAKFYCGSCKANHQYFEEFREHRLQPSDSVDAAEVLKAESKKQLSRCSVHEDKRVEMLCETCSLPVCTKCCLISHSQHEYRELDLVAVEFDQLAEAANKLMKTVNEHLTDLETSEKHVETAGQEEKVTDYRQAASAVIKSSREDMEFRKASLLSLLSYVQILEVSGNIIDQVRHSSELTKQLRQVETAVQESVDSLSSTWAVTLQRETQTAANLNVSLEDVSVDTTVIPSGSVDDTNALGDPVFSLKPDVGNNSASALAVVGDHIYIAGLWNPHFWVHNIKKNISKRHTLCWAKNAGITALQGRDSNTVIITDREKKLHFITMNANDLSISEHTVKDLPFSPRKVTVDSRSGKLTIVDKTNYKIVVCDTRGNVEKEVALNLSSGRYGNVSAALATDEGHIVLQFSIEHGGRVLWINKDGEITNAYGQHDSEQILIPQDFARDTSGRLIVAEYGKDRLQLIGVNKALSCYLPAKAGGIKNAHSVSLDETTQRLYVTHKDEDGVLTLTAYKWPTLSSSTSGSGTRHELSACLNTYNQN